MNYVEAVLVLCPDEPRSELGLAPRTVTSDQAGNATRDSAGTDSREHVINDCAVVHTAAKAFDSSIKRMSGNNH